MDIPSIAQAMRNRMPWPVGQLVLAENDVPRGMGWDRTVARLTKDENLHEEKSEALANNLREHILCGEKLTRFYKLDLSEMESLREAILNVAIPETPFSSRYPASLTDEELKQAPTELTIAAVERLDDGLAVVFGSVRVVTLRESLDQEELPEAALEALHGYDELVGVRHVRLQTMDVVWVPHDGQYVDVRIDYPQGMLREVGDVAHERVRGAIATLVGRDILSSPENLFPLIDLIYSNQGEGLVVELAFGTTTASLKHERMRRRTSCLRSENYHKGGKAALMAPIEPYKLSVVWKLPIGEGKFTKPELSLYSSARMSGGEHPVLSDAIIRRCVGSSDFGHVRDRIEFYLSQASALDQAKVMAA